MDISRTASTQQPAQGSPKQKLLRFLTCGNVDDGKSTLIGRLLWDTKSVMADQAAGIGEKPVKLSDGQSHPDFAGLLDGLLAEREQGITIDVAYRYFSTPRRSFIVADTPGHKQYTRNMVTGASTADLAVLLVDARSGITEQTRRHALIASLTGIRQVVLVVNKMDLVGYDANRFAEIESDFRALKSWIKIDHLTAIPVAAVHGFNVVYPNHGELSWYNGPTLLECLENAAVRKNDNQPFRLSVQRVSRPDERFRGFQGTVSGGPIRVGQEVTVHPSNQRAAVERIVTFDGDRQLADPGDAVTLVLDRKIDTARGYYLADASAPMTSAKRFEAQLMVLDDAGIKAGGRYWLKSGARLVQATVLPRKAIDLASGEWQDTGEAPVNTILQASLHLEEELFFDPFNSLRETGSFILVDPDHFGTVAGGMISHAETAEAETGVNPVEDIHIRLPADMAIDLLSGAARANRLSELVLDFPQTGKLDPAWLEELQSRGLTLTGVTN